MFQSLESRVLMSASLVNGTLMVGGTLLGDQIRIDARLVVGGLEKIFVTVNSKEEAFSAGQVHAILVDAGGGDDNILLSVAPVSVTILGGNGNDRIHGGGDGNNLLVGGAGRDTLLAGSSGETLLGGTGNDHLIGSSEVGGTVEDPSEFTLPCTAYGGAGDDLVEGGSGNDYLSGDEGNDSIEGHDGNDSMLGGAGDDVLTDTLRGGPGDDDLEAFGHNDKFVRGGGDDRINTEPGHIAKVVID